MCYTAYYISPRCKCKWLRIERPCAPGLGFSTCPYFFDGTAKPQPPCFRTSKEAPCACCGGVCTRTPCPVHELRGNYDRNEIRMVLGVTNGLHWGMGPDRGDVGVEMACCVVM